MTTPVLRALVGAAAVLSFACGGSESPARPVVPAPPTPTPQPTPAAPVVIDGWSEAPVAGAEVVPATVLPGAVVTVRAPGFLTREQPFDGRPVALWPAHEGYVGEIVYGWRWSDGRARMIRWDKGFVVTLEGSLASDGEVVAKVQDTISEVRRATGLDISIGSAGAVTIAVDPDILVEDSAVGEAQLGPLRGGFIASARMVFSNRAQMFGDERADYRNTLLHEFGHIVGLSHSPSDRDVMHPLRYRVPGARLGTYSADESMVLHMMYAHRRTLNVPVDRDPAVTTAAFAGAPEPVRD